MTRTLFFLIRKNVFFSFYIFSFQFALQRRRASCSVCAHRFSTASQFAVATQSCEQSRGHLYVVIYYGRSCRAGQHGAARRRLLLAAKYYVYAAGFASLVQLVKKLINWFARRLHPKPPKLMMSETSRLAQTIREQSSVLTKPYYVTPWLFNGVVQTLSSLIPMRKRTVYTQREIIHLEKISKPPLITCCPDVVPPGVVSVDWLMPDCGFDDATPIVIIVPGLTGHSHSTYIERVSAHFAKTVQKYRVASTILVDEVAIT